LRKGGISSPALPSRPSGSKFLQPREPAPQYQFSWSRKGRESAGREPAFRRVERRRQKLDTHLPAPIFPGSGGKAYGGFAFRPLDPLQVFEWVRSLAFQRGDLSITADGQPNFAVALGAVDNSGLRHSQPSAHCSLPTFGAPMMSIMALFIARVSAVWTMSFSSTCPLPLVKNASFDEQAPSCV